MIKENEQGILIVVSGPSGCGKSTVNKMLIDSRKNIIMSVSDTTRAKRNGEMLLMQNYCLQILSGRIIMQKNLKKI